MSKIFVVIPVFNRLPYTKQCLKALRLQGFKNFEVILIDDGSSDGTEAFVKKSYPEVKIIKGNGEWWWTKSMVEGIRYSLKKAREEDFVLALNNDCYFGSGYLKQLLKSAKKYPNAIVGSICVKSSKRQEVVEAGIRIDWPSGLVYGVAPSISNRLAYFQKMKIVDGLDALPGKGTLISLKVIKKIGNFNYKKLPHYVADYEFTNRAKRAGFDLLVDTHAVVLHHWDATGDYSDNKNLVSYKRAWNLMFGRKSMNNIIDWINFLFLACPKKYLLINLWIVTRRLRSGLFSVFPLFYLKPYFMGVRKWMYHVVLFPKYHILKKNK